MSGCYCCKLAVVGNDSALVASREIPSGKWVAVSLVSDAHGDPCMFSFQVPDAGGPLGLTSVSTQVLNSECLQLFLNFTCVVQWLR